MILERKGKGEERGRLRDRQTDRHTDIDVREKHRSVASRMYPNWELNILPRYVL